MCKLLLSKKAIQLFISDSSPYLGVRLAEAAEPISPDDGRSQSQSMFTEVGDCGCVLANALPLPGEDIQGSAEFLSESCP